MTELHILLLVIGQFAPSPETGGVAREYSAIVRQYDAALKGAGGVSELAQRAKLARDQSLETLLERATESKSRTLRADDLKALAESAELLGRLDEAVAFASAAVRCATDFEPFVPLVRCLCALARVDEAETAIRTAAERFPGAEKQYLLHNFLAIKYRDLNRYDDAFRQMDQVIVLVTDQLVTGPFYVAHLGRCLNEQVELADRTARAEEVALCYQRLRTKVGGDLAHHLRTLTHESENPRFSERDFKDIRLRSQALLVINDRSNRTEIEGTLVNWLSTLAACDNISEVQSLWVAEFTILLRSIESALCAQISGVKVAEELKKAQSTVTSVGASSPELNAQIVQLRAAVKATAQLLEQHQRHAALVGKELFSPEQFKALKGESSPQFLLVHILKPLDRSTERGLRAVGPNPRHARDPGIRLCLLAIQSGLMWDSGKRIFAVDVKQTLQQEAIAVDLFRRRIGVQEQIGVLPRRCAATQELQPVVFPINVLLDAEGRIVSIVSGAESHKSTRLLELAKSHPRSQGPGPASASGAPSEIK